MRLLDGAGRVNRSGPTTPSTGKRFGTPVQTDFAITTWVSHLRMTGVLLSTRVSGVLNPSAYIVTTIPRPVVLRVASLSQAEILATRQSISMTRATLFVSLLFLFYDGYRPQRLHS